MADSVFNTRKGENILNRIHNGMRVYDRNGEEIGKVDQVYLGETSPAAEAQGKGAATVNEPSVPGDNLFNWLSRAFDGDRLPETVRNRLLYSGFIHVDADSLLASDRYVMADQIGAVEGERVKLKASKEELIKR